MYGHAFSLILAGIAVILGVAARLDASRKGSKGASVHGAILLGPCAIIIGTLPWVLHLGETVKIAASVTSIIVSLAAIGLLIIQIRSRRRT